MSSVIEQHKKYLKTGGIFVGNKGFIKVSGPERTEFLHRISSQDIKNLEPDMGAHGSLLEPSGQIISLFDIYHCGQFFLLVMDEFQLKPCLEHLEKMHFAEDLEIENISDDFKFASIQGLKDIAGFKKIVRKLPKRQGEIVGAEQCFVVLQSDLNNDSLGFHIFVKEPNFQFLMTQLEQGGIPLFDLELWKLLRLEAGYFDLSSDVSEKNIILEVPLQGFVHRDKGCYPGQEVVERIFTYGNISKKMMGLYFRGHAPETLLRKQALHIKLLHDNEDAGYLTSLRKIPWSDKVFGFGIVRKPFYHSGQKLKVQDVEGEVELIEPNDTFEIKKA